MLPPPVPAIKFRSQNEWASAKILEYPAGFTMERHRHDDACIQVVLQGKFHEDGWRHDPIFTAGEVLFRPAGFEHANAATDEISIGLSLQLDAASAPEPIADWIKRSAPMLGRDPHIGVLASRISRELATPDGFSPTIIDALCVELLVQLFRIAGRDSDDPMPRLANEAADLIRDRLDVPLSIESVAKALGTDRFRLNRAFSRHKGMSPAEFLRLLRIEKAKRLLLETREPLSAIALMCGFADQSHMTKSFRAIVGVPPARFRQQRP